MSLKSFCLSSKFNFSLVCGLDGLKLWWVVRIGHIYRVWQLNLNKIERVVKFEPVELQKRDWALFVQDK